MKASDNGQTWECQSQTILPITANQYDGLFMAVNPTSDTVVLASNKFHEGNETQIITYWVMEGQLVLSLKFRRKRRSTYE